MAATTQDFSSATTPSAAKANVSHPLCPLTASEITTTANLLRSVWPANIDLRFKVITLDEPPKKQMIPYLEAEHSGRPLPQIPRKAFVSYYIRNTDRFHEAVVNLSAGRVESNVRLGPNMHGNGDYEEILLVEKNALEDEGVKAALAKLKLPEGTAVTADPWIYGSDGIDDDERLYQVFLYMRDPANPSELDSNHYAFPLPISPVLECNNYTVIRIDYLPTGADNTVHEPRPYEPVPPNEYIPEAQPSLRKDLKPLRVIQPEGASFTLTPAGETGHVLEWQKWSFRVGYNQREGMVLYDVRYDSRPLFYRLSLSDMNIPYADPRHPYHKKAAYDLGDAGAGAMANNLKLGCDCLGHIQYLSAVITDDKGKPTPMENCVCIHEQDAGIGWKHTNYRTGRAAVVRNRELVLQSIITVSNYEYILAFMFNQAGEVIYEVRATGILSTQPIDHELDKVGVPFGTVVHPGVLAVHHQHIFSLRIDPMLEGHENRLVYDEAHAMPLDKEWNPHGVGYTVSETVVEKAGGLDIDVDANRVFKIQNPRVLNPVNGKPVAYKIHVPPFQKMLAHPSSFHFKRAEFADHNIYVTTHRDRELYAGGWYTNQSRGGTGVRSFAARNDSVKDTDIVVWVQFGINHVPRIEDFPVMPCEILKVSLKPVNFFDKNPALDVPPSEQSFNQSTLASNLHHQPAVETVVGKGGECCGPAEQPGKSKL
ncbi:Copper amine oxidase 1 [Exophiala dermatitidis]